MNSLKSTIILMRHGETLTTGNPEMGSIFRGLTDDELSQSGWQEMAAAVKGLPKLDTIVSSPLLRCSQFARKLARERGLPWQQTTALSEIDFGQWEGKAVQQLALEAGDELSRFWQDPLAFTPPDGEAVRDFQHRVITFWNDFLPGNKGKNSLIITHGGVLRMILAQVLSMPVEAIHNIEVPYGCCSTIHLYYSGQEIITTLSTHGARWK